VEGSPFSYGNVDLTKRLVIIGPGYFLGQNPETQACLSTAIFENIAFNAESDGSFMTGMTVISWTTVQDTGIVLARNHIGGINLSFPAANCQVLQNWMELMNISGSQGNIVSNNLITRDYPSWSGYCFTIDNGSSATVRHNIFGGCQTVQNCLYENNVATGTAAGYNNVFTSVNSTVRNNLGASTQFGNTSGNQADVDISTVFIGTGSEDGKYRLLPGSPAAGAGYGGVDCGIFGGSAPYELSGIPNLPAVGYLNINGNSVTVRARSH